MSDGEGGGSSRGNGSGLKKRRKNEEFARSLARVAVAQICEGVGLQGFQQSAIETLSDITCKYIQDIGRTSNFCANLAGRTESNVFDIVRGLEDLGLSQGFVGASDIGHCLSGSGIIKDISQYVGASEEVGFAYSVPPFPVIRERQSIPSFFHAGETPPVDNIPPWLPCFPDPTTYAIPATVDIEQTERRQDGVDQDHMVIGPLLLKSEQCLACNGSQVAVVVEVGRNGVREQVNNPFLASPLQSGEKEVSLVSLPARLVEEEVAQNHSLWANHASALGTFAPGIQGLKSNGLDIEEGSKKVVLERRHAVQLKFHVGKKSLTAANRQGRIGNAEAMSWFANDDLRDDKRKEKKENSEGVNGKWEAYEIDRVVNQEV
ncbi:transcription initiation factor TFIID subunit 8-like [Cynara cardunculus var. scolymus]|uniref:transcription initiation factor TFIID subunit 8-like n=1 Tax=Cynara cardunculus var. scolymus TaxID=59895 RepID=UPI000D6282FC|nr:transcription initiation factor TFIID subunit 8-like [Cynara cardunculus var. scolymus]